MKFRIIYIALISAAAACSRTYDDAGRETGMMPVLFSAGNTDAAVTRASAAYMPQDSRFVCSMFFHAGAGDTEDSAFYAADGAPEPDVNMITAWMKVSNTAGNAVYWNRLYDNNVTTDIYGFDEAAKCFYWQNRMSHVFLALADNNTLTSDDGSDTGSLKIYPDINDRYKDDYMRAYDLTKGEKTGMAMQPDPIQAVETARPSGATAEANRVRLSFKHQFSQVQVNLKNSQDASVTIDETLIESVELLGVAETGYVAYCIKPDGTVPATTFEPVDLDDPKYSQTKKDNPFGSSFSLFQRNATAGYLKSFEGIAFGTLQAIRITWKESDDENAVRHVATFKGLDAAHKNLKSGTKYIYNMELRRSIIAQVTAVIASWDMDDNDYDADATIQNI